ncbi:MAG: HEAT repeat domain-containing protein [Symploca sp. SIO3E6]|nr:HEAT repeat domain-containing protein [Caldora sp. SIO3E6]
MIEPLTTLGVSVLGSLVLKEVLPELGKGALEDYVKDFFKDFIKGKIPSGKNSLVQQALGKTLQQFVKLIELELEYKCDLSGAEIRDNYQIRIKGFLQKEQVKSLLGSAFASDCHAIDGKQLALIWRQHYSPAMPAGFNWHRVATKYVEAVKDLIKQLPELREILELETLQVVAEQTKAIAGIPTDFNLEAYQEGLKERYANLNLDSLDASVYDYREKLKVWQVFVPQYVRQCQEFLPQVYEIPKEHQRQLRQSEQLEAEKVGNARTIARLLIEQLRSRNFILCFLGGDVYAFVHRTFLEYFCAWEYVWQFQQTQNLSIEQLKTEVFGKHWQDESWQEVLQLIAGMIDAKFVGQIIEYLIEQTIDKRDYFNEDIRRLKAEGVQNLLLAANCLGEVRNKNAIAPIANRLQALLIKEVEQEYPYQFDAEAASVIVNAIATVWQDVPQTLNWLKSCVQFELSSYIPESAIKAIAQHWKDEPDTLPLLKQWVKYDDCIDERLDSNVRQAAVRELAKGWKDDPDTLPLIQQWAQSNEYSDVRKTAVRELAKVWKDDPDTLPLIKQWAQFDDNSDVRQAAVRELAKGWKDEPDTLTLIKQRVQSDEDSWVRRAAVQELAKGWKDEPDTLTLIKQWAQSDEDSWVRRAAVEELAKGWKDEPDTLTLIKQWAQSDEDSWVRRAAVEELAKGWKDEPDTLTLIKQRVQSDEDSWVRRAAVEELAKGWKDEPDTLTLIKQRVQSDKDSWVRQAAVRELAKGWKDDPDTLTLIKQRAQSDDNSNVRQAAIESLARNWQDEPGMVEFLSDRVLNDPFKRQSEWEDNPRQVALELIIKQYPNHPDILPLLQDRAENDSDEKMRKFAKKNLEFRI